MALLVWDGDQYIEAGIDGAEHAYIWDGTDYVEVWANYTPIAVEQAIPEQTTSTASSYVLASFTVPGPVGDVRDCQTRLTVNWANRQSGQQYRVGFFINGSRYASWESAPDGSGAFTQVVEIGYGTSPYPSPVSVPCGGTFEVRTWVSASNAANRIVNPSTLTLHEV